MSMTETETKIARGLIADLLQAGYRVGVNDGEDTTLYYSNDADAIFKALCTTGEDYLLVAETTHQGSGISYRQVGWFHLIWGNGFDLVSNSSGGMEAIADMSVAYANKLQAAYMAVVPTVKPPYRNDTKVDVFEYGNADPLHRGVALDETIGDDLEMLKQAAEDLVRHGYAKVGGGAAPFYLLKPAVAEVA